MLRAALGARPLVGCEVRRWLEPRWLRVSISAVDRPSLVLLFLLRLRLLQRLLLLLVLLQLLLLLWLSN